MGGNRDQYVSEMETKIQDLRSRAEKAEDEKTRAEARDHATQLEMKLHKIKEGAEDKWENFKGDLDGTWNNVQSKFKDLFN